MGRYSNVDSETENAIDTSSDFSRALQISAWARYLPTIGRGLIFSALAPLLRNVSQAWERKYPTLFELAERAQVSLQRAATCSGVMFSINQGIPLFVHAGTYETASYGLQSYEPFTREIFTYLVKPGARVLDLGAQFGLYTILAARKAKGGQIVAFEPEPQNFALLQLNVRFNRVAERVVAHRLAVGERASIVDLFVYEDSDSHSIHRHPEAKVRAVLRQDVVSIDEFLGVPTFDLIKMDIEGHEPYAIKGMQKTLEKSDDVVLICEMAPEYLKRAGVDPGDFLAQLSFLGFDPKFIDEEKRVVRAIDPEFLTEGHPGRAANLLCRRR